MNSLLLTYRNNFIYELIRAVGLYLNVELIIFNSFSGAYLVINRVYFTRSCN